LASEKHFTPTDLNKLHLKSTGNKKEEMKKSVLGAKPMAKG